MVRLSVCMSNCVDWVELRLMSLDDADRRAGIPLTATYYRSIAQRKVIKEGHVGRAGKCCWTRYVEMLEGRVCDEIGAMRLEYEYPYMVRSDDGASIWCTPGTNSFIKHCHLQSRLVGGARNDLLPICSLC